MPHDTSTPILIDGSEGEGGGQVLRSALTLSLITQRPFTVDNVRAKRATPGLRLQHLACVRGAEHICGGVAEGAEVGSRRISFMPKPVRAGSYLFEVGSAGSAPLLLQCLLYPLALAGGGELTLRGGTHVPHSPSYHYLAAVWMRVLEAYGLSAELKLRGAGYYPEGGGEIRAKISPAALPPLKVDLPSRGTLGDLDVTCFVSGLSFEIAERALHSALTILRERGILATAEKLPLPASRSMGMSVFIHAVFENTVAGFSAIGERGKPAEDVGREAALQVAQFMETRGALDPHLADQMLIPAALLAAGRLGSSERGETAFTTSDVTSHLKTNAQIVERFLPVRVAIDEQTGLVTVSPR